MKTALLKSRLIRVRLLKTSGHLEPELKSGQNVQLEISQRIDFTYQPNGSVIDFFVDLTTAATGKVDGEKGEKAVVSLECTFRADYKSLDPEIPNERFGKHIDLFASQLFLTTRDYFADSLTKMGLNTGVLPYSLPPLTKEEAKKT